MRTVFESPSIVEEVKCEDESQSGTSSLMLCNFSSAAFFASFFSVVVKMPNYSLCSTHVLCQVDFPWQRSW